MSTGQTFGGPYQQQQQQQQQNAYLTTDRGNIMYNPNSDTEMLDLGVDPTSVVAKRTPFDWFILSVLGCFCFPYTGICAMYYAWRANHGLDFNINRGLVDRHNTKAKVLTIVSICLGLLLITGFIIMIVVMMSSVHSYATSYNSYAGK